MTKADIFWQEFLHSSELDPCTAYIECFHFELNEKSANALLQLVLQGKKRATASSLECFTMQNIRIPQVGDYSIVTNWEDVPACIIQTTQVTVLPFKEVTFDICKREGEDECLESWRKGHIHFFTQEGKEIGYSFHEEMMVVFEDFEVVYSVE